jgi:hypothetical protein
MFGVAYPDTGTTGPQANYDLVSSVKDAKGFQTNFTGYCVDCLDPTASNYAQDYSVQISNPDGQTVTDSYNATQLHTQEITGSNSNYNSTTQYVYTGTASEPVLSVTDPMNNVTVMTSDGAGDVLFDANDYGTTTTAYNSFNEPCWSAVPTVTVPSGTPSCTTPPSAGSGASFDYYNGSGDLIESIEPDGRDHIFEL